MLVQMISMQRDITAVTLRHKAVLLGDPSRLATCERRGCTGLWQLRFFPGHRFIPPVLSGQPSFEGTVR